MRATRRVLFLLLAILILTLFFAVPVVSWADRPDATLDAAAHQLADKITAALPPREAIFLDLRNLSSLSGLEVAAVRRALESELQSRGLQLVPRSAPSAEVRLTLSETPDGFLWVVEVPRARADAPQVEMVSLPKPRSSATTPRAPELLLEKKLIWEQEEQILDVALLQDSSGPAPMMLILEPKKVSLYRRQSDRWELRHSYDVPAAKPWPRDLRGQILLEDHFFQIHLPGIECDGDAWKAITMECEEIATAWTLSGARGQSEDYGLAPRQNFFFERPSPGVENPRKLAPFYSYASVVDEKNETFSIYTDLDGRTRIYGENSDEPEANSNEPEAVITGWGSEIAGLESDCGNRSQILATQPGDVTVPDAVRAFEIINRRVVAVSPAVELPGPVIVLWTGSDNGRVIAVARNLKTGRYEAYHLSISCGR